MGHRAEYELGHNRDSIPEGNEKVLHSARRMLIHGTIHAERFGFTKFELEGLKLNYQMAKAASEEAGPDLPQPHGVNGFTIYWDKRRRLEELLCDFHGISVDKNGHFDGEELARRMLSCKRSEFSDRWNEYLMSHVERNAAEYNMPPEWVEEIRSNIYAPKPPPPDDDSDGIQQYLLTVFYELR